MRTRALITAAAAAALSLLVGSGPVAGATLPPRTPSPGSVWTSAALTAPFAATTGAAVSTAVLIRAGGAPSGSGFANRSFSVEISSTGVSSWRQLKSGVTGANGTARPVVTAPSTAGRYYLRLVVAASSYWRAVTTPSRPLTVSAPTAPGTVWTTGTLTVPAESVAGTPIPAAVVIRAGGASSGSGSARRSFRLETSADGKAGWTTAVSGATDTTGRATVNVPGPAKQGSLFVRLVVPVSSYWKAVTTTSRCIRIVSPIKPVLPEAEKTAVSVPVTPLLFGNHPLAGTPESAGTVRLWDTLTSWSRVEVGNGEYDWRALDARIADAEAAHQQVLLVLGSTPSWAATTSTGSEFAGAGSASMPSDPALFERYVRVVVSRYGSRIAAYQIWNEANIPSFWQGTAEQMADLTLRASRVIKELQPAATVVAASVGSRWVTSFTGFYPDYLAGLKARGWPIDAFAVHLYPKSDGTPLDRAMLIGMVRTALDLGDAPDLPLWETEVNYGVTNPGLGEAGVAIPADTGRGYVARTFLDSLRYGIARSYWYGWTPGYHLLGVQMFTGLPAAAAMARTYEWLVGSTFTGCTKADVAVDCAFTRDGSVFHVVYTDTGTGTWTPPAGATTAVSLDGVSIPVSGPIAVSGLPVRVS